MATYGCLNLLTMSSCSCFLFYAHTHSLFSCCTHKPSYIHSISLPSSCVSYSPSLDIWDMTFLRDNTEEMHVSYGNVATCMIFSQRRGYWEWVEKDYDSGDDVEKQSWERVKMKRNTDLMIENEDEKRERQQTTVKTVTRRKPHCHMDNIDTSTLSFHRLVINHLLFPQHTNTWQRIHTESTHTHTSTSSTHN